MTIKNLLFFMLVTLVCGSLSAQCPTGDVILDTQAKVNDFASLYPNCTQIDGSLMTNASDSIYMYSDITDLSPLNQITSVGGDLWITANPNLMSLNGLENLTSVGGGLWIYFNNNLTNINDLKNLTSIGEHLSIENNANLINLIGLESVTSVGKHLFIWDNDNLTNLSGLEGITSVGTYVEITYNDGLTNFNGLDNLTSIGYRLEIIGNDNLINLNGLENLTSIEQNLEIWGNDNLTNLNGLNNLTSIDGQLRIFGNDRLSSLIGLENIVYSSITNLRITDNPMLSTCSLPSICNYLENGGTYDIDDNASGCDNRNQVSTACSTLTKIQTKVFYDINQNKNQDTDEPNYDGISLLIEPDADLYRVQNGVIYIAPGSYTVTFDEDSNSEWQLTTDPTSYSIILAEGDSQTITFGIYPTQQTSHIQATVNAPPARCNETITFDISAKNLGTTTADDTLWLEVDENILATTFINTPDTTVAPNRHGWYFDDLFPSQSVEKRIALQIPGPPDFPLGDSLVFNAYVDFEDENGAQSSETFTYETEVRCSYDPNDKLVNPNREGDYVLFDENLIYTIRFQNTGNDVAYDVVIRDTLDANLDLSTFKVLGTSHPQRLNTSLRGDGMLTFEFTDIFLPDSTSNFEASQGYVSYLIHTIDGLAEETLVTNSAGIYFDLNPPIITNTTESLMVSQLPTISTTLPDDRFDFMISPNPNTGIFQVRGIAEGTYQILNTSGQIIRQGNMENDLSIDIATEAQGVYFISITIDNETFVKRMIKM